MKRVLILMLLLGLAWAQKPLFTEYVTGTAQSKEAQIMFYLQNVSSCVLQEVQVRISHNKVYNTTDSATFVTNLQPQQQETFVFLSSQVVSEGWGWTIDAIKVAEPEGENTCNESGNIEFEKVVFAGDPLAAPAATVNEGAFVTYTVKTGDSWFAIASLYNTTPEIIALMNDRRVDMLIAGEVIKVPAPSTVSIPELTPPVPLYPIHTITSGDTLFALARTYNTQLDLILQANCLNEDSILKVGQELQIPPAGTVLNNSCQ